MEYGLFLSRSSPIAIVIFFIGALSTIGCASPTSTPVQPFTLRPQAEPYVRAEPIEHYLYLPQQYTPDREWPLFMGLHGYGGSARDCLSAWQPYADQVGFVLVCPSLNDPYGGWEQDVMKKTLHEISVRVRTEARVKVRVFLAGFSAGGHLAQRYTWAYPDDVAAVAVLSAVTYDQPEAQAKDIPFLVALGDSDHLGGVEQVEQFTQDLQRAGFNAELHILPGVGHTLSDKARELTREFFKQTMSR
jgi:poly(3-hydroxybutyrate) depolymerase